MSSVANHERRVTGRVFERGVAATAQNLARVCAASLFLLGCERHPAPPSRASAWVKVELDLSGLDEKGLAGRADGKVTLAYEFAIPDNVTCRAEVRAIDRSIRFMRGSRGRIGAGPGECLCVGETGPGFHAVLETLAALPYVKRIIRCDWE
jgi:hypothetical protein